MKRLFFFGFILLLFGGCRKETDGVLPADPSRLVGAWRLVNGPANYTVTLTINPISVNGPGPVTVSKRFGINGTGPVNTYAAMLDYGPHGDSTKPYEIRITNAARGSKVGETEEARQATERYFNQLANVYVYELSSNGQLHLIYGPSNGFSTPPALIYQRQ